MSATPAGAGPSPDADRARGYRFLADLFLHGIRPEALDAIRRLPDLAGRLPDPFDPDAAAAAHHRLFGLQVVPCASVFLEADGRVGGLATDAARRAFGVVGSALRDPGAPPDHVGHELDLLAACVSQDPGGGARAGGAADPSRGRAFLESHVLWWLPVFVHSARRSADPFWTLVLELTLELVVDHGRRAGAGGAGTPTPPLPDPDPPRLGDRDTGLRDIAGFLATPARCGLHLSMDDIRGLGRGHRLPGGFGGRARVLETLLGSAATYGSLEVVLEGVDGLCRGQEAFLASASAPDPSFTGPWLDRLSRTRTLLDAVGGSRLPDDRPGPNTGPDG